LVDFRKHLGKQSSAKSPDPIEIYKSLDRSSDKGDLRPLQSTVLREWHSKRRSDRDVILKVHTGQGKTLLGLLMLQAKLNEGRGPALYLCPNHFLVNQTMEQSRQFGIQCITAKGELPDSFLQSRTILVTVIDKLFNGENDIRYRLEIVEYWIDRHRRCTRLHGQDPEPMRNNASLR
jgi:replicative superfamily II helicase